MPSSATPTTVTCMSTISCTCTERESLWTITRHDSDSQPADFVQTGQVKRQKLSHTHETTTATPLRIRLTGQSARAVFDLEEEVAGLRNNLDLREVSYPWMYINERFVYPLSKGWFEGKDSTAQIMKTKKGRTVRDGRDGAGIIPR